MIMSSFKYDLPPVMWCRPVCRLGILHFLGGGRCV